MSLPVEGKSWQNTQNFLKEARIEGADLIVPKRGYTEGSWSRSRSIGEAYFDSPETTLPQLGKTFGVTKANVAIVRRNFLWNIWKNASPPLQEKYPLDTLDLTKPTPLSVRIRVSETQGSGVVGLIVQAVEEGKGYRDLRSLGVKDGDMSSARGSLRELGIEVPYQGRGLARERNKQLAEKLRDPNLTDQEAQKLLDRVDMRIYDRYKRQIDSPILSLNKVSTLVRGTLAGKKGSKDREVISQAGIPMGMVSEEVKSGPQKGIWFHHFLAAIHEDRAVEALRTALSPKLTNPI